MIQDKLESLCRYSIGVKPDEILDFLYQAPQLPCGRYELSQGIFANIQQYETHSIIPDQWEAHRKYLDIQVVLSGTERIYWKPVTELSPKTEYDPEKDIQFFCDDEKKSSALWMNNQIFAIFFPQDGHLPCCMEEKETIVKKVVVKIPCRQE